ncbi:cytochrome c oxidase assembly protein [Lederbergia wuyishanensis]|uniref:Membrane protein n=1 Tax=Lederbergia wuyishanensis TaxID=1347903 RepID=A0ABU0D5I9_9BACI|nr:cytochrome c oxidase assembly protein [Lederbergia wuyishanensis]MCJ8009813.1 cytochrome c oxidase assembly protein [Lederbergia wuyishanensis]MDQ0343669.1 putative membrane protein [Lederbergia wuyishanensis]
MFNSVLLEGQLEWNFTLLFILAIIAIIYALLLKHFSNAKIYQLRPILFFTSLTLFFLMIGSPLSVISHLSFSFHMIQMSILYFIVPPLFLFGIPDKLKKYNFKFLTNFALISFTVLFFLYHMPFVLQTLYQVSFLHKGYTALLFALAIFMWWPIVMRRNKRFALISGILLTPACLLFIVNGIMGGISNPFLQGLALNLCLPEHIDVGNLLPISINPRIDQIASGIVMMGLHKFGLMLISHISHHL